jgi:hypothetical protein
MKAEVQVRREEHYACGCSTTHVQASQLAARWLLRCNAHDEPLSTVVTVMDFKREGEEEFRQTP